MTSPSSDGAQFRAEAEVLDDDEKYAREILERKQREREERQAAEEANAPVIVDETTKPEDDPLHMELSQHADERDGDLYDSRNNKLLEWNESGLLRYAPEWEHRTVTYKGTVWQYRDPKKLAMMFMAASTNTKTSPKRRIEGMIGFLAHSLSERSLDKMQDRAFDFEDEFDTEHMSRLMQFITSRVEGDQDQEALDRKKKEAKGELG